MIPDDATAIDDVLRGFAVVAVVGLSPRPDTDAFAAAEALLNFGISVVPVHTRPEPVLGIPAVRSLHAAVQREPDLDGVIIAVRAESAGAMIADIAETFGGTDARSPVIWLEPAAASGPAVIAAARATGLPTIAGRAIADELDRAHDADPDLR
jgi:predicted CoA-binding protein